MMLQQPARLMSDESITAEIEELAAKWDDLRRELEGMSGSPGEWMIERMDELETEKRRRLISLDGDIGRRHQRI